MRGMIIGVALSAALGVAPTAAPLTRGKALAIMHERHEGMEKIGDTNKLLRREITSSSPFLPAIRSGAATIAGLSVKANGWFPKGTGPATAKTGAKPEIWQKPQDFAAKLHGFQAAARAFNAAARSGDMAAIKARYADLGASCKACHDSYRAEMKH
ncbi:MAG: c-type cytochrome [Sphingomicrobium sp.]